MMSLQSRLLIILYAMASSTVVAQNPPTTCAGCAGFDCVSKSGNGCFNYPHCLNTAAFTPCGGGSGPSPTTCEGCAGYDCVSLSGNGCFNYPHCLNTAGFKQCTCKNTSKGGWYDDGCTDKTKKVCYDNDLDTEPNHGKYGDECVRCINKTHPTKEDRDIGCWASKPICGNKDGTHPEYGEKGDTCVIAHF